MTLHLLLSLDLKTKSNNNYNNYNLKKKSLLNKVQPPLTCSESSQELKKIGYLLPFLFSLDLLLFSNLNNE